MLYLRGHVLTNNNENKGKRKKKNEYIYYYYVPRVQLLLYDYYTMIKALSKKYSQFIRVI